MLSLTEPAEGLESTAIRPLRFISNPYCLISIPTCSGQTVETEVAINTKSEFNSDNMKAQG